jgi:hypothetical protein
VRRNDEIEAQRSRWTFYEVINFSLQKSPKVDSLGHDLFLLACTG